MAYGRYSRRRGYRRARGSARNRRKRMRKTAISVLNGTSVSRTNERTLFPRVLTTEGQAPTPPDHFKMVDKPWTSQSSGMVPNQPAWSLDYSYGDMVNYRYPEFYAFRDGLYSRFTQTWALSTDEGDETSRTYFVPIPGCVLGKCRPIYKLDSHEKDYPRSGYAGKVMSFVPGSMWNYFREYAGIARGQGPGSRIGTAVRSLSARLTLNLRPAVLGIPIVGVSDGAAADHVNVPGWDKVPMSNPDTSYVMPTWAMVIVFSYRPAARDYNGELRDVDKPSHKSNTLNWIRNNQTTTYNDRYGRKSEATAEYYIGNARHKAGLPAYDIESQDVRKEPWDYNLPASGKAPIRRPSDVTIDSRVVKVWRKRIVYFRNRRTALRDTETELEARWATGRQFDYEYYGANSFYYSGQALKPGGNAYPAGTVGTDDPPGGPTSGHSTRIDTNYSDPGIAVLQSTPSLAGRRLSFDFSFNGKEVSFDDRQDQEDTQVAAAVGFGRNAAGAADFSTTTSADAAIQAERTMEAAQSDVSAQPRDGDFPTADAVYNTSAEPLESNDLAVIPVQRWHDYTDNPCNGNLYFTVITPTYPYPVKDADAPSPGASPPADWTADWRAPHAFQVPNWGSVPVKVVADSSFRFKK